jgi:hypothetical protein
VGLLLAGCGGDSHDRTGKLCAKAKDLCGKDSCPTDAELADAEKKLGKEVVTTYMECAAAADSCAEMTGCAMGLVGGAMGEMMEGMGKGMQKQFDEQVKEMKEAHERRAKEMNGD